MNSKEERKRGRELDFSKQRENISSDKELNEGFLKAIRRGNPERIQAAFDKGASVNFQSECGFTPLHMAAFFGARHVTRALIASGEVDVLSRDNQGRLASELAFIYAKNIGISKFLRLHERKQADELGIQVTHRPR